VINGQGNTLYYLLNDLYKMPISAGAPSSPLVVQGARVFYSLGLDPLDETIYVGDAIDYNQNGTVLLYQNNGTYLSSFKSGIIPGYIRFDD
jgi:DNA-binding beta-propeller fold protein YncE